MTRRFSIGMAVLAIGCSSMQLPGPASAHGSATVCSGRGADDHHEVHDLGSGLFESMAETAPGFIARKPSGWKPPNPLFDDDAAESRAQLDAVNDRNAETRASLERSGARVTDVTVDGLRTFEVARERPLPRIHVWFQKQAGYRVLAVWEGCPHVCADETCKEGQLVTTLRTEGTTGCLPPGAKVEIAVTINGSRSSVLVPLGVVAEFEQASNQPVAGRDATVAVLGIEAKRTLYSGSIEIGSFSGAGVTEVLTLLHVGNLPAAQRAWRAFAPDVVSETDRDAIVTARIAEYKSGLNSGFRFLNALVDYEPFSEEAMPGDDEVRGLVLRFLTQNYDALSSPSPKNSPEVRLALQWRFADLAKKWSPASDEYDHLMTDLERRYGPVLVDGKLGRKGEQVFTKLFPESKYLEERDMMDVARARSMSFQRRMQALDNLWAEVTYVTDDIARKRHMARMGRRYAPATRNPTTASAAADAVEAETRRMLREDFCTAKKAFVDEAGLPEFQKRAAKECTDEPPVGQAELGREVSLANDCRVIMAHQCPP